MPVTISNRRLVRAHSPFLLVLSPSQSLASRGAIDSNIDYDLHIGVKDTPRIEITTFNSSTLYRLL